MKILVVHGPNLNLLGSREPEKYGILTMEEINDSVQKLAEELDVTVEFFQSNCEGTIVTKIQEVQKGFDGLVINPAAYTHTSIAIRDAVLATTKPCVEVHLSNIYTREEFRHNSYIAPVSIGQVSGFKIDSYLLGFRALVNHLREE